MNNFFLIDKPIGISSFDIIRQLRKKFGIKKMGHTGTLDPLATGGVLVATGNYTKLIPYFEKDRKEYYFRVRFDGTTDSYDLSTPVTYTDSDILQQVKKTISQEYVENILDQYFTGEISQIPPKYSALKVGGKKSIDLIRQGKQVELLSRIAHIYEIEVVDFSFPDITFRSLVSAGTYIRSIAVDIGTFLGTGGYVVELRRTRVGDLDESLFTKLDIIGANDALDIHVLFPEEYCITLDESILKCINNGLPVYGEFNFPINEYLFVVEGKNITNIVLYDSQKLIAKRRIL